MKLARSFMSLALAFSFVFVSFLSFSIQSVNAQNQKIALQRGYRTGYSDGYMSGYRDVIENVARGFDRHNDYLKADRAYSKDYGVLEDYRDGYQQGFEAGYNAGFEKRSFDAALPIEIRRRGTVNSLPQQQTTDNNSAQNQNTNVSTVTPVTGNNETTYNETTAPQPSASNDAQKNDNVRYVPTTASNGDLVVVIPVDTELIVEILGGMDTDKNKEGDMFQARVVSPSELDGAIIEGRISRVQRPGRIKRRAELSLSFERILLSDNRWANYNAMLTEVLPIKGDNIRRVDTEGTVEGKSSVKSDSVRVGASTGTGMVIGAIAGGPAGAAVGAGVGAAFGVGASIVDRGKHVNIIKGQQLRIRTVYETRIR
jgi:hypothetical protein